MCLVSESYAILGFSSDSLLHLFRDQTLIRSFGGAFRIEGLPLHPMLDRFLGRGRIDCDASSGNIVVVAENVGELRQYSFRGALQWARQVTGYLPSKIYLAPSGRGVVFEVRQGGWHQTIGVHRLRGGAILLQAAFVDQASSRRGEHLRLDSFVFDSLGNLLQTQVDLPQVIFADDDFLIGTSEDPYPRVSLLAYKVAGGDL